MVRATGAGVCVLLQSLNEIYDTATQSNKAIIINTLQLKTSFYRNLRFYHKTLRFYRIHPRILIFLEAQFVTR